MAFAASCSDIKIKQGVLSAQCKRHNAPPIHSQFNLNEHIGFSDNKLVWGGKGFVSSVENPTVSDKGILTAKFKSGGKTLESTIDLNSHIKNTDGVLESVTRPPSVTASPKKPADIKDVGAVGHARELSAASATTAASAASASNMFSATSSVSSATTVSHSSSSTSTFTSTHFRKQSKHLLIQDTCTNLVLKGTILHVDCRRIDGVIVHASIDLDEIIGFIDGRLEWDHKHFSKHCFEYTLDGFVLVVKYRLHAGEQYHIARLDLRTRLRNADGILILVELDKKLSVMLSEVPWMKFKVIAEPDLSVFAKHPVMQETLVRIAETTVEHVTVEMHKMLTIAMESAITAITASAMKHVSAQMETLVMDVAGQASASASITGPEHLHIFNGAQYGYGYQHGYVQQGAMHYANGHVNGNGHLHGHNHNGQIAYAAVNGA
ncbi:hypothetical protein D9613_007588 [Agrocybe pediades]|uniref:Cyanovirin-N domain-containing protein n=1 Tax=Agrocybe pediades TaxID=84607 RepID=A0A8H4QNF0_9AGAR|nr:hypothetical protein D9613_007588 [Agrocybe pediades]